MPFWWESTTYFGERFSEKYCPSEFYVRLMRHNSALLSISLPTPKGFSKLFEIIFILLPLFCCPCKKYYPFIKTLRGDAHDDDDETCFLPLGSTAVVHHVMKFSRWPRWTWYRIFSCGADVRECHADIVSSRFTLWRRSEKNSTSVFVPHWSKLKFFDCERLFPAKKAQ